MPIILGGIEIMLKCKGAILIGDCYKKAEQHCTYHTLALQQ